MSSWIEKTSYCLIISVLCLFMACGGKEKNPNTQPNPTVPQPASNTTITLFTFRYYPGDEQLLQQFKQITGIDVRVVLGTEAELIDRLQRGESADVFLASSIQAFFPAKTQKLTQPFFTEVTGKNVPSRNTDLEGHWLGLSRWAPAYIYNKAKVDPATLQHYVDITKPTWRGKVASGNADEISLQTIVTGILSDEGTRAAQKWVKGLAANRIGDPLKDDFEVIKAVAEGKAEVGIIKSSFLPILQRSGDPDNFKTADAVGLIYPSNDKKITYHNLTVAGLLLNTPNRESGLRLIEFLSSQTAQEAFGVVCYEYPVNPFSLPSDFLIDIGGYREGKLDLNILGKSQDEVKKIMTPLAETPE